MDITAKSMTNTPEKQNEPIERPIPNLREGVHPSLVGDYRPSPDGCDSNILILFHGLGDSDKPFAELGQSLNLPQTACLSIRAPLRIPLLEEDAWMWWESFDGLGDVISAPDPSSTLEVFEKLFIYLTSPPFSYPASSIHFLGYGQGGSLASHLILYPPTSSDIPQALPVPLQLGSLTSISAPLLTLPTGLPGGQKNRTPCLVWVREGDDEKAAKPEWYRRGFEDVQVVKVKRARQGMPQGMNEWRPIMQFWSKQLRRRNQFELDPNVHEITSPPPRSQQTSGSVPVPDPDRAVWDYPLSEVPIASSTAAPAFSASTTMERPEKGTDKRVSIPSIKKNPSFGKKELGKKDGFKKGFLL